MQSITDLHKQLLLELERIKEVEKIDLSYTLRKDNFGRKLENGYWFLGDESIIYLSFWEGQNWITKTPNIGLIFDLHKELILIEVTVEKESKSKLQFIQNELLPEIELPEESDEGDYFIYRYRLGPIQLMKDIIFRFIFSTKEKIDDIISEHQRSYFIGNDNLNDIIGFIDKGTFRKSLVKVKNYFDYMEHDQDFEFALGQNKERPFYLRSFKIENFGSIKTMVLNNVPSDNRWIFITGANGSGKSMLLRALASFLGNGIISNKYFRVEEPFFEIELIAKSGVVHFYLRKGNNHDAKYAKRSMLRGFAAYGVHRTAIRTFEISNKNYSELSKNGFLDSIMKDQIVSLIDYNEVIVGWTSDEENNNKFKHRKDFFIKALLQTVPGLVDIHFRKGKKRMISEYFIRYGNGSIEKIFYNQLSSGSRSILSFVADIIVRYYHQQPEAYDPSEFRGIVLVDEIDLHLHPQGQKDLILALSEIFPNIQFIVSTHSPIPLLAAPPNSVFLTVKQGENVAELIRWDDKIPVNKLLPNALFGSPLFDLDDYSPVDSKIEDLFVQDDYEDALFSYLLRKRFDLQKMVK